MVLVLNYFHTHLWFGFRAVFGGAEAFNQLLSTWDVSRVTNMFSSERNLVPCHAFSEDGRAEFGGLDTFLSLTCHDGLRLGLIYGLNFAQCSVIQRFSTSRYRHGMSRG
jgi:surface protein